MTKNILIFFLCLAITFSIFYIGFSNFYALVFALNPENNDILSYHWDITDSLFILFLIGYTALIFSVLFLNNQLLTDLKFLLEKTPNTHDSLLKISRSPPIN